MEISVIAWFMLAALILLILALAGWAKISYTRYLREFGDRFRRLEMLHSSLNEQHEILRQMVEAKKIELWKSLEASLAKQEAEMRRVEADLGSELVRIKTDLLLSFAADQAGQLQGEGLLPETALETIKKEISKLRLENMQVHKAETEDEGEPE